MSRRPPAARWARRAAALAGVLLVAAAVVAVVRRHETIGEAFAAVRHPAPLLLLLLAALVAVNVMLTALLFSILISRYGRVRLVEMQALVAAATLANFLPLRPGLFGRVAYHRAFNAIPVPATAATIVQSLALSTAVAAYVVLALLATGGSRGALTAVVALPLPLLAGATAFRRLRVAAAAALVRYLEVLVWALRYYTAFALIGLPIGPGEALAFACVGVVAMLVPLFGNGLGLREWAVGLAAPLLTPHLLEQGLAADLVNRAAELAVITPLGLAGAAWLAWRGNARPQQVV